MRYLVMQTFYHRLCDRAGRVLHEEKTELPDLQAAMAQANKRLCTCWRHGPERHFDPGGRIEIADCVGRPVARIYCAEVLASLG
jgi:hypothetical protein